MKDPESENNTPVTLRAILLRTFAVLLCTCILTAITFKLYLNTHHAAKLISKLLTSYLHQPARITSLRMNGGSFSLSGISIGNPPKMPPGNLVDIDSVIVSPSWSDLLMGRQHFRKLALSGLRLNVIKNEAGTWNYSDIVNRFASDKSSEADLFVTQFAVTGSSIQVNGQGVKDISLQLSNLSTKGSRDAQIRLSFEDAAHSSYVLNGTLHPGNNQSFKMVVTAQALSFAGLYGMLNQTPPEFVKSINGGLTLNASLDCCLLRVAGNLDFNRSPSHSGTTNSPLNGSVRFTVDYDTVKDTAKLSTLTVVLNDLITAKATGTASRIRSERHFNVDIGLDRIDIARLATLLTAAERKKTVIGGYVAGTSIHLSGSGTQGVTQATGSLQLHDGSLEREGELVFKGLASTIAVNKDVGGFRVNGKLFLQSQYTHALLETLDAPFTLFVSNRLQVLKAELPELLAVSRGLRVTGRIGFSPQENDPLTVSLRMSVPTIATLQPFLGKRDTHIISGSAALILDGAGRGVRDFSASTTARFTNLNITAQAGKRIRLKNGSVNSSFTRKEDAQSVEGNVMLSGMALDDKTGDTRFSFSVADRVAVMENCKINFDGALLSIGKLTARISPKESSKSGIRYPLRIDVNGGEAMRGPIQLNDLSGSAQGFFTSDSHNSWMEGVANLSVGNVAWQGKPVASPVVTASFSRTDVNAIVTGNLLGGTLSGDAVFNPAAADLGAKYRLGIKGIRLSQAGELLPKRVGASFSDGTADASISGTYSSDNGIAAKFDAAGTGISVTGNSRKTVLTHGGFALAGELSHTSLTISTALLKAGEQVSLKLQGNIKNPLDIQRDGHIAFSVQQTPLTTIVDQFINSMPRFIQEATVDGSISTEGSMIFRNGTQLLKGLVRFANVNLDVPSQKMKATDINGTLPFSFDVSGKSVFEIPDDTRFTRDNFPRLLTQISVEKEKEESLRIGSASFGSLSLGEVQLSTIAEEGGTKLVSLRSSLYEGALHGSGLVFVNKGNKINYQAGLLINGLSLKRFCATIPSINDYISGRLDGVISIKGEGNTLGGINGLTELWVREGSGEKMLISKTFLQKLSGKKLNGFFFRSDRSFNQAEISAKLLNGYLTFDQLDISNTNLFGVRDLSVTVAPAQNRIALDHLFNAVKQAAVRGKAAAGDETSPAQAPLEAEFKWQE